MPITNVYADTTTYLRRLSAAYSFGSCSAAILDTPADSLDSTQNPLTLYDNCQYSGGAGGYKLNSKRALLYFDALGAAIPSDATVSAAVLHYYVSSSVPDTGNLQDTSLYEGMPTAIILMTITAAASGESSLVMVW